MAKKKASLRFMGRENHVKGARLGRIPPDLLMNKERPSTRETTNQNMGDNRHMQLHQHCTWKPCRCHQKPRKVLNEGAKMKQ